MGNINFRSEGNTIVVGNLPADLLNRWTQEGQVAGVPKLYYNDPQQDVLRTHNTTRFMSDASFIRLRNVNFSYNLPSAFASRLRLKTLSLSLSAQNLWMYTKYKGEDPEAVTISGNYRERNIAYGILNNTVPQPKTLVFGLNVGF